MIAAFLATWLFALSSVAAKRSVLLLGSSTANLVRIVLAALLLGVYAHTFGAGLHGVALGWFIVSGLIGYGVCDTAIFLALPLIGAIYALFTVQSAIQVWRGRGGMWKGRVQAPVNAQGGAGE